MKKNIVALLLAFVAIAATPAWSQNTSADVVDMDALRNAVRSDKKALIASALDLTPAQARRFWPIYDAYQRNIEVTNRKRALAVEAIVGKDQNLTDVYARSLANELIANDEAEIKARRKMHNRVMRALPPMKAARYLQLEAKIRAVQDYDIASAIPLVR